MRPARRPEVDPELCLPGTAVVALIPEVRPRQVLRAFRVLVFSVRLGVGAGRLNVGMDEVEGATGVTGRSGREVITPKGARLLKRMFEAGLIRQRRAASSRDLSMLDAYIATEPEFLRQTAERRVRT